MFKTTRRRITISLLVSALLVVALLAALNGGTTAKVRIVRPTRTVVEQVVTCTSLGTLEAEKEATVSAEIAGKIVRIFHREGANVASNDAIVRLDATELEAEIAVIENEIRAAELRKEQIQLDLNDARTLREKKIGSPHEEESLHKETEIQQAVINRHLANKELIKLRLSKTSVRPPFNGRIVELLVEEGEFVHIGSPLFRIMDGDSLLVRAPIDEVDSAKLKVGQEARVEFDALPGKTIRGTIAEILPTISARQKNDRTVDIKVRPELAENPVRAGASAKVYIIVERTPAAVLAVPTNAIIIDHSGGTKHVFVLENGIVCKRTIRTGLENWEMTEVSAGLKEGDRVIMPLISSTETTLVDGLRAEPDDTSR